MQGEEVVDGSSHVGVQLPRRFLVNVAKNLCTFSEILKTMRLPFYLASFEEAELVGVGEYKKGDPEKAREMLTETLLDIGVDEVMRPFLLVILCLANLMWTGMMSFAFRLVDSAMSLHALRKTTSNI